jgi:hypothetical protein
MFDSTRFPLSARLTDAADLLIDFATLGEYGLEPVERAPGCQSRRRPHTSRRGHAARATARGRGVAGRV